MDISSHRGKIVLNQAGEPFIVFVMHHMMPNMPSSLANEPHDDEPAVVYLSLPKKQDSSGIYKYYSQGSHSVDLDPDEPNRFRKNYYRVFFRAASGPIALTDDHWGMQLEWGGDDSEDGYIGIISGYQAPKFINAANRDVVDTFYITAVTPSKRDPDLNDPNNNASNIRFDEWLNAKLVINTSKLPSYNAISSSELSYVPLTKFIEHHQNPFADGSVNMEPTGAPMNDGKFTYAGTAGRLPMGMYILTKPKQAKAA